MSDNNSGIVDLIDTIDVLRVEMEESQLNTAILLKIISQFTLDWGESNDEFAEEYDFGVTKPILLSGLANKGNRLKTSDMLIENNDIARLLINTFFVKKILSKDLLFNIHKYIIKSGGQWRKEEVTTIDKNVTFSPAYSEAKNIDFEIYGLINWYNEESIANNLHPVFISFIFHYNFLKIHPFLDGNGRMARILSSLILLSYGIPPPTNVDFNRREYLTCLRCADEGDIKPLIIFASKKVISSIKFVLFLKNKSDA